MRSYGASTAGFEASFSKLSYEDFISSLNVENNLDNKDVLFTYEGLSINENGEKTYEYKSQYGDTYRTDIDLSLKAGEEFTVYAGVDEYSVKLYNNGLALLFDPIGSFYKTYEYYIDCDLLNIHDFASKDQFLKDKQSEIEYSYNNIPKAGNHLHIFFNTLLLEMAITCACLVVSRIVLDYIFDIPNISHKKKMKEGK